MKPFMNADFLLPDESSKRLFHDYAAQMPIMDYHCHLPPADIANDSLFRDLAHAWLGGDHYKSVSYTHLDVYKRQIFSCHFQFSCY